MKLYNVGVGRYILNIISGIKVRLSRIRTICYINQKSEYRILTSNHIKDKIKQIIITLKVRNCGSNKENRIKR